MRSARRANLIAEQEIDDHVHGVLPILIEIAGRPFSRRSKDSLVLNVGSFTGHDIGTVAVHVNHKFDDDVLNRSVRVVTQPHVCVADICNDGRQSLDLRIQGGVDDLAFGLDLDRRHRVGCTGELAVELRELWQTGWVGEQTLQPHQRIVASCACTRPVRGERFFAFENLFGYGPCATGCFV